METARVSTGDARRQALVVAAIYTVVGLAWVFAAERLMAFLAPDARAVEIFHQYKGWFYVVTAAVVVYTLVRRRLDSLTSVQRELSESRRTLSTLMSNLPGMAYRCLNDADWTMEFVSDGCTKLTGHGAGELVGSSGVSYASLILDEDLTDVWDTVQECVKDGRPFQMSYRIRDAAGGVKRVWEQGRAVAKKPDGRLVLEGFITDITEHMKVQRELDESRRRYKELIRNLPVGLCRCAGEHGGGIVMANDAFARMLGYGRADDVSGVRLEDLCSDEAERACMMEKLREHGRVEREVIRLRRKDGTQVQAKLTTSTFRDENSGVAYMDSVVEELN